MENEVTTKEDVKDYMKGLIKEIVIYQMKIVDLEILLNQSKKELEAM